MSKGGRKGTGVQDWYIVEQGHGSNKEILREGSRLRKGYIGLVKWEDPG